MRNIFGSSKGFTMLELLMVIIIIGILATLALPQYTSFVERARASEATNTIGAIRSAESLAKLETGSYTTDLTTLSITVPTSGTTTYWTYGATAAGTTLTVTATRTSKSAPSGKAGLTITCAYDDSTGAATWGGTYTEVVPKN